MDTNNLFILSAALMVVAMGIAGFRSLQAANVPSGYWALAWAALAAAGVASMAGLSFPELAFVAPALSCFFAPLMVAGSLQHVGRKPPAWLLPAAGLAAGLCLLAPLFSSRVVEHVVSLGFQPVLLLVAAAVLTRAKPRWQSGLIQLGLVTLAAISVVDALADLSSPPRGDPMVAWIVIGVSVACLQIVASHERTRRHLQRAETETRRLSGQFEALLSSMAESAILLFDASGKLDRLLGAQRDEFPVYGLTGSMIQDIRVSDVLSRTDIRLFDEALRDVAAGRGSKMISIEADLPAGVFSFEIGLAPLCEDDGAIDQIMGIVHDVTEHVTLARQLRQREQSLTALLSALVVNRVIMISPTGTVDSVIGNVDFPSGVYGLKQAEVEGLKVTDLLPGPGGERVLAAVQAVFHGGGIRELEERVELPGGEFHFAVSLRPLLDETGAIEKVLAVCADVTARVQQDREREEFEVRVQHAQKLESLGVLAGGIAHDFNNLLTGILGNAGLALEEAPEHGTLRQCLRDIETASESAATLTAQLLAYAGRTVVSPITVELSELVEEMTPLLRTGIEGGAELQFERRGGAAWVRVDVAQIRQVVMNLITNALESLPERGGRVDVETSTVTVEGDLPAVDGFERLVDGREYACVTVRDTGSGMDDETLGRIFEPFYTTKFEGRGLGLAAALGIVRSHDGSLQVESKPGEGTTFRVLLPRVDGLSEVVKPERDRQACEEVKNARGTVLIVDDEPNIRKVVSRMLEGLGYTFAIAEDGRDACRLLAENPEGFDVALVDLTMPDWPGERVCSELRSIRGGLPVVFMTGHSEQDVLERAGTSSGTGFLAKPFRRRQLEQVLADSGSVH